MPDREYGQDFMVPKSESDAEHLVLIHALRVNADAMKRIADQQDRISGKVDSVSDVIHDIDKRLAVIEGNSLSTIVKHHDERITELEDAEQRRRGAIGLWEFVLKSWPTVIGFALLIAAVLVANGRVHV